jgi:2-aminoadipate transaminase
MGSSAIRELLKLTAQPDIISFAGGLPAPEVFPVPEVEAATRRVLAQHGSQALQYSITEGYVPLREWIVNKMAQYGIEAAPENVLITSGSQQALDLIGKILLNPGDRVLTERPTYLGALQAWQAYQADYVTVPIDDDGLCTGTSLKNALSASPKFMYLLPNFQNPSGVTMSLGRRWETIAIADRYGIPIIEDDTYGELSYEGEQIPPLIGLDARKLDGGSNNGRSLVNGNVIYLSTFSKTLAPGLRLGWMVAPTNVIEKCVMAKQGMDLHTSIFVQMIAYELVKDGFLKEHVNHIRQVYRERRDVMLAAMSHYFPPEVRWTRPQGGLFLWVTLPEWLDTADFFDQAIVNKVAFVPGTPFFPDDALARAGHNTMRLNFSYAQPEQIEVGIRRLGEVLALAIANRKATLPEAVV